MVLQDMVHLMEAAGFQPDLVTVNCLLNMYADGRQPDLTEELFGKLSGLGITVGPALTHPPS